jgi:hypothetical protein
MSEFKFPDEIDVEVPDDGEELNVEIEDDTPPEDRGVDPLPEDIKKDLEKADDSAEYSHNVKTKFKQYKKAWHDERRAKESALREQQEALAAAQNILNENKRLREMLQKGETELISTYKNSAELEVERATRLYKEAYDEGDTDKLLGAQQDLIKAQLKLDKTKNYKPTLQDSDIGVQQQQKQPQVQPQMDPRVATWVSQNPWFVDPGKRGMRRYAEGVHEELAERYGQAFVGTDEYYKAIDREVHKRFPEEFDEQNAGKSQRTRTSTVVAPAKRSTAPKKIVLSKTQVGLAKKLGLTPEQYAREMIKLEN